MSIITGKIGDGSFLVTTIETEVICPICTFGFDAEEKMEKAKNFVVKMKCPACKGKIGIDIPVFGGNTRCYEWDAPKAKSLERLETETDFKINGVPFIEKLYDDNSDEPSDIFCSD